MSICLTDRAVLVAVGAYLAVGVLAFLPLNWWSWRRTRLTSDREKFWAYLAAWARRKGPRFVVTAVFVQVVAWPAALWEGEQ